MNTWNKLKRFSSRIPCYLRKIALLGLFWAIGISSFSQTGGFITGKVVAENTRLPIPYATLFWEGFPVLTTTDEEGGFRLAIPETERGTLKVSSIGFKSKFIPIDLSTVQDLVITIEEEPYFLPTEEIVVPQDVLKKAFEKNKFHYYPGAFSLEMMIEGQGDSMKNGDRYYFQALGEFFYEAGYQNHNGLLKEKRILRNGSPDSTIQSFWADGGIYFYDKIEPPCPFSDKVCWAKKIQTQFIGTKVYDGKKVYLIELTIDNPKVSMVDGAKFNQIARFEATYIIDSDNFAFLRRESRIYAKDKVRAREYGKRELLPVSWHVVRDYRPFEKKYFLSMVNTSFDVKDITPSKWDNPKKNLFSSDHRYITITINEQKKFNPPPLPEGYYYLWEINQVPYKDDFWQKYDSKLH